MALPGSGLPWQRHELDNLTELAELTEKNLLESIKKRYEEGIVYTDVGDILVSINPFKELAIYTQACSEVYSTPDVADLAPHIFRSAARAFSALLDCRRDQVFVISGESGAGKTESAKLLMRQFMAMCRSSNVGQRIQEKIVQTNPLLEAFGNATTVLNNNSSRFGKFLQLVFTEDGRIMGAGLEEYLVEKSRVSCQAIDERNFHIFYYIFAGLPKEDLKRLKLKSPLDHRYLKAYPRVVEDCSSQESRSQFQLVVESLQRIGFLDSEYKDLLTLLATILHIGDIEFYGSEGCEETKGVLNPEVLEFVSLSTGLDSPHDLVFVLTTLRTVTRGETIDKPYTCAKAADVRDAIAKTLYQRMFRWIIHHINVVLEPPEKEGYLHMGILDIFGFEIFVHNSFEQFCINLANEQLQQYFNHHIFAMEKAEYAKEGVDGLDIHFRDNKPVLDLFLMRPIGLLSLLEEQSRSPKGSDAGFVQKCRDAFQKKENFVPHRGDFPLFSVKHYAAEVEYEAEGFLEKNNDSLPAAVVSLFQTSSNLLINTFFNRPEATNATLRHKPVLRRSQVSTVRKMSTLRRSTIRRQKSQALPAQHRGQERQRGGGGRKGQTVTAYFRESLQLLMERLCAAGPHFIRCIKPNQKQKPLTFDSEFVVKQLRYTGMVEAIRVRRQGYSFRPFFSDFVREFHGIAYKFTEEVHPSEASCKHIMERAGIEGWKLGRARVFLRYFHEEQLHAMLRDLQYKAALIQKVFRGHTVRKRIHPLLKQAKDSRRKVQAFLLSIPVHGTGIQDLLIRLNHTDVKLKDKRFPKHQPKPDQGPSRAPYTGLEYHDYGVGSHHWPGEGPENRGVAPKPWMVPAIPLASGPKLGGWRRSTAPKEDSRGQSELTTINSFSMEALDEVEDSPILPRAQLKRSDSIDDDTLKRQRSGNMSQEQGITKHRESKIQQLKMKLLGSHQQNKRRAKSDTDSGPVTSVPAPSAPPQSTGMVSSSDNISEPSFASDVDKAVMPVCFHRSISVEAAKILMSERDPGAYIAIPSTFRSLYGEEYILIVSQSSRSQMYPIMRSMDSSLYLQAAGDPKAVVKFFTLEHLIRHYKREALPGGTELKEPVILGGVRVAGYSKKQVKSDPKKDDTARASSWKGGLKLPWKKRNPPPPKRQDWEI